MAEKIVAIGSLTHRELERLGNAFTRHLPPIDDELFARLRAKLDQVEATPLDNGVALHLHPENTPG